MIVPTTEQLAQIDAAEKARADAVGDRERLEKGLSEVPELFASVKVEKTEVKTEDEGLPTSVTIKYVSTVPNVADSMTKIPAPPPKAPSHVASSSSSPPLPDPVDSVPPSVVSERPTTNAVGDHEREEIEPDNVSEADYGASEDEEEDPRRIVDDDQDGTPRPLSEFETRVAMAIVNNTYDDLVDSNRCWRCRTIFPTGTHICGYCAAPLTDYREDAMTIDLQSTEAMREFNLEFHWVLRGAGTTRSDAKKARDALKSATKKKFSSIADIFQRDAWYRREKQRLYQ